MKKLLVFTPLMVCGFLTLVFFWRMTSDVEAAEAAQQSSFEREVIKALNIQNKQLDRIADALERISGQQPGWKLPN